VISIARAFVITSIATFAGCSAPQLSLPQLSLPQASAGATEQPQSIASWVDPGAKTGPLLYVAGGPDVEIFQWPTLQTAGVLKGFRNVTGACVDGAGNVWITDSYAQEIYEYAHGGTTPISTLDDPTAFPNACAVDKRTGTLAVGNGYDEKYGEGSLVIYKHATGAGTVYFDPGIAFITALDYAPNGNLFLQSSTSYVIDVQKFARKKFKTVQLHGATIKYPAGLQYWKGGLTVAAYGGSVAYATIYQISETGRVTGRTMLTQTTQSFAYQIFRGKVICPDYGNRDLKIYPYPAGGAPIETRPNLKGISPWTAIVSPATAPKSP
jgi:hypothetical protein